MTMKSQEISASSALIPSGTDMSIKKTRHILHRGWRLTRIIPDKREKVEGIGSHIVNAIIDGADIFSPIPLDPLNWIIEGSDYAREVSHAHHTTEKAREHVHRRLHYEGNGNHHEHPYAWKKRGELALLVKAAHEPEELERLFPDKVIQNHIRIAVQRLEDNARGGAKIDAALVDQLFDRPQDPGTHKPIEGYAPKTIAHQLEQKLKTDGFAKEQQIVGENAAALARHAYRQDSANLLGREKINKWANRFGWVKLGIKTALRALPIPGYFFVRPKLLELLHAEHFDQIASFLNHPKLLAGVIILTTVGEVASIVSRVFHNSHRRFSIKAIHAERKELSSHIQQDFSEQVLSHLPNYAVEHPEILSNITSLRRRKR